MIQVFFCRTCHGLSNAVYRWFIAGGGGGGHPPPGRVKVAQTPGRARVNDVKRKQSRIFLTAEK